eukprot:scaffold135760_cov25-Tisochrysis_lutea.AAC.2
MDVPCLEYALQRSVRAKFRRILTWSLPRTHVCAAPWTGTDPSSYGCFTASLSDQALGCSLLSISTSRTVCHHHHHVFSFKSYRTHLPSDSSNSLARSLASSTYPNLDFSGENHRCCESHHCCVAVILPTMWCRKCLRICYTLLVSSLVLPCALSDQIHACLV